MCGRECRPRICRHRVSTPGQHCAAPQFPGGGSVRELRRGVCGGSAALGLFCPSGGAEVDRPGLIPQGGAAPRGIAKICRVVILHQAVAEMREQATWWAEHHSREHAARWLDTIQFRWQYPIQIRDSDYRQLPMDSTLLTRTVDEEAFRQTTPREACDPARIFGDRSQGVRCFIRKTTCTRRLARDCGSGASLEVGGLSSDGSISPPGPIFESQDPPGRGLLFCQTVVIPNPPP
jgi:hypothetical protein